MRYPLDSITITGAFKEVAQPGTGLPDAQGVRRHIGVDLRASVGTKVYAIGNGTVTASYDGAAGKTIEIRIGDKLWRFMHLSRRDVAVGASVTEGQVIGLSGNSGGVAAHLHVDARKDGTTYNASLNNYFDPLALIAASQQPTNQGDDSMSLTTESVKTLYRRLLNREGDAGGVKNFTGKTLDFTLGDMVGSQEFKNLHTVTKTVEVPKEVIKEVPVEKIVEKEVIKEVPVEKIVEKEVVKEVKVVEPPTYFSIGDLIKGIVYKLTKQEWK